MLDGAGEGKLTHAAFNRVVGPLIFPSSWGFSATMCVTCRQRGAAAPKGCQAPSPPLHATRATAHAPALAGTAQ